MPLKITHKYSTVTGTPPASGDIDLAEIAINAADAELYVKDSAGNIRKFQNTTTGTADGVQFTQVGTGAVQRTVESKLKDVVSVKDFGAVAASSFAGASFQDLPGLPRPDNTSQFQSAIDHCIANRKTLVIPSGSYYFSSASGLVIDGNLEMAGEGNVELFVDFTLRSNPKGDAFLTVTNNRKGFSNISIRSNSYLGVGIKLSSSTGENQKFKLDKITVETCRYGLYVDEPECINQLEVVSCSLQSNYYWGIYINSYTPPASFAQSAPIHFLNTICNGNGPTSFAMAQTYSAGPGPSVTVKDTDNDIGGQLWMRGFSNVQYIGGQLSGHNTYRNQAIAVLRNGNSFCFYGTDIEDIPVDTSYTSDGATQITAATAEAVIVSHKFDLSGAAIVVESVTNFSIDSSHLFEINTIAAIKLTGGVTSNANIGNITPVSVYGYTVWDTNNDIDYNQYNTIHPSLISSGSGINGTAFQNLAIRPRNVVLLHNEMAPIVGTSPNTGTNVPHTTNMWQNGAMADSGDLNKGWKLVYLSNHDEALTASHLYNEIPINRIGSSAASNGQANDQFKWIFVSTTYANSGDGRFAIQALDSGSSVISSAWYAPGTFDGNYPISGTQRFAVPVDTKYIRYGFVNSQNYSGNMKEHFCGNFDFSQNFFFRLEAVVSDTNRFGVWEPPYTAAVDAYRT